jgi:4-hydroxyproline epimerase
LPQLGRIENPSYGFRARAAGLIDSFVVVNVLRCAMSSLQRVHVVDSHTGGEPTRVVISGGPDLGDGPLSQRVERFRRQHDAFRSAVVNEPRGSDAMVGAILVPPHDPSCAEGVIFFNNVGYLGMCVHGTIGVAATLAWLGRMGPGEHRLETPVGVVTATLHEEGDVTVENVPSYRHAAGVEVELEEGRRLTGDVAWGGNWFFLTEDHGQALTRDRMDELTRFAWQVRRALSRAGICGAAGAEIDHIELFGSPTAPGAHSKNFVLCPGGAYDRSPCGTGTSAKLACLAAAGELAPGEIWRQESIVGSVFEGSYRPLPPGIVPRLRGAAFVNAEATLILDPRDPFCTGIRAP